MTKPPLKEMADITIDDPEFILTENILSFVNIGLGILILIFLFYIYLGVGCK